MWNKLSCLGLLNIRIQEKLLHSLSSVTSPDYVHEQTVPRTMSILQDYTVAVVQLSDVQKMKNGCSVSLELSLSITEEFYRTSH